MNKLEELRKKPSLCSSYYLRECLINIRRRIWNKGIKLWWYRLFVRKDEFHPSLDIDAEATMVMNHEEYVAYRKDLELRRKKAQRKNGFKN